MATTAAPHGVRYTDGMDAAEKYAFDLGGYVVLRGMFTPAEVATMNLAVDTMAAASEQPQAVSPSLASAMPLMWGEGNIVRKIAARLSISGAEPLAQLVEALGAASAGVNIPRSTRPDRRHTSSRRPCRLCSARR